MSLDVRVPLRAVEYEYTLLNPGAGGSDAPTPPTLPDCGYGLLFFDRCFFFAWIFSW